MAILGDLPAETRIALRDGKAELRVPRAHPEEVEGLPELLPMARCAIRVPRAGVDETDIGGPPARVRLRVKEIMDGESSPVEVGSGEASRQGSCPAGA